MSNFQRKDDRELSQRGRQARLLDIANALQEERARSQTTLIGSVLSGARPGESVMALGIDGRRVQARAGDSIYPGQPVVVFDRGDGQLPIVLPSGIHSGGTGTTSGGANSGGGSHTRLDRSVDIRRNRREEEDEPEILQAEGAYIVAVRRYVRAAKIGVIYSLVEEPPPEEEEPPPEEEEPPPLEYACPRYTWGSQDGVQACIPTPDPSAPYRNFRECADAHPIIECERNPKPPKPGSTRTGSSYPKPNFLLVNAPWDAYDDDHNWAVPHDVIRRRLADYRGGGASPSPPPAVGVGGTHSPDSASIQPAEPVQQCRNVVHFGDQIQIVKHKASGAVFSYGIFDGTMAYFYPASKEGSQYWKQAAVMTINPRTNMPGIIAMGWIPGEGPRRSRRGYPSAFSDGKEHRWVNPNDGVERTTIFGHYPRVLDVINNTSAFEILATIDKPEAHGHGPAEESMCRELIPNDPFRPTAYTPSTDWIRRRLNGPPVSSGTYNPPPPGTIPPNCRREDPPEGVASGVARHFYVGGFQEEPIKILTINVEEEFEAYLTLSADEWKATVKWGKEPEGSWCKVETFGGRVNDDWQAPYAESTDAAPNVEGLALAHQGDDANIDKAHSNYLLTIDRHQNVSANNSITNKIQSFEDELLSVVPTDMTLEPAKSMISGTINITPITNRATEELGSPFIFGGAAYRIIYEEMINDSMEAVIVNGCPYIGEIHQISPWKAK